MTNEQTLIRYLKISQEQYDAVWHFSSAFSFKLQPVNNESPGIHLFFMHPKMEVYSYKISGQLACKDFFIQPLVYLLQAIEFYNIKVGRITVAEGGARKISQLKPNDSFTVYYQAQAFGEYNLRMLLTNKADYRVAWSAFIERHDCDQDRDYDSCFEMGDGGIVSEALKHLPFKYTDNPAEQIRHVLHKLENLHFENYLDDIAKQYNTRVSVVENALKAFNGVDKKLEQKLRTGLADSKKISEGSNMHAYNQADAINYFISLEDHGKCEDLVEESQ